MRYRLNNLKTTVNKVLEIAAKFYRPMVFLDLSIPVKKLATKELIHTVEISYQENWQTNHWRAITSAYKNSPYFDYFEDEIKSFYTDKYDFLLDYNLKQLQLILKILKQKKEISLSSSYHKENSGYLDYREKIHPKIDFKNDAEVSSLLTLAYYQTFESKFTFHPNLSILDLLFNVGLDTSDYLKKA